MEGINTYQHSEGQSFKHLPEISNIETCSACNLECPMCLRSTHLGRQPGLVDMKLLKLMKERGDFGGSHYIELQMAGEPTLHPKLFEIVNYLKHEVGVLVGLSTHGLSMEKPSIDVTLGMLDALTISVDSVDPETYHRMRFPAHLKDLYRNLDKFFKFIEARKNLAHGRIPMIELQLVKTPLVEKSGDLEALQQVMKEKGWDRFAVVRTIYDCFEGMQDRVGISGINEATSHLGLCLNPFTSVSIAHNGDVVSCCMIFTPRKEEINYYGNLYEQSLEEIWNNHIVKTLRHEMMEHEVEGRPLHGQCAKCTVRSPAMIHNQIVSRLVQLRGL